MQQIGPYTVLEELARGGQGVVYRARDADGRVVALKLLLAQRAANQHSRKRFQVEVQTLSRLQHPNVVSILATGEHEGAPWLALEFVEGESLETRLRHGPLPIPEAIGIAQQLAQALSYMHERGVLHRDLKPDNVLLRGDQALLTDFGLARDEDGAMTRITTTGVFLGTPGYWPPEQARGELSELGPRSDVYGLGAILYACLTAHPPVQAESFQDFLKTVRFRNTPPPSRERPEVPEWLSALCMRCLAEDPDERPASADEVARALDPADPQAETAGRGSTRSGLWLAAILAGGLLLATGGVAWVVSRPAPASDEPAPPREVPTPPKDTESTAATPQPAIPANPFKLPRWVIEKGSAEGAFLGDVLFTATTTSLQVWTGRELTPELTVALPPAKGLLRPYGVLPLGREHVLIGGDEIELSEWTPAGGFRPHGLRDLRALVRHGDHVAYGLRGGEFGVFALAEKPLAGNPATLDLSEGDTNEVHDLTWLSPTRLLGVTGGRVRPDEDLAVQARAVRESRGALHLLGYDPESKRLTRLDSQPVLGAQKVAASGGEQPTILVGTSTGNLFVWRVEADERLVAAGESYREPGAPLTFRDLTFVRETVGLGALVVRRGVGPGRWEYADGVFVYDLADPRPRVYTVPGVSARSLVFEPAGEQVIVLGDRGQARVLDLETILEDAEPLDR